MNILVIGNGGREHALTWKIAQSPLVEKIYCAPGNAGTSKLAENIPIAVTDIEDLLSFASDKRIDLTVVGPEDPLVNGIVDEFEALGHKIFGPGKTAARLEGSKVFAKNLMHKYNIPTAQYEVFDKPSGAYQYIDNISNFPVVLKASGLAAGKGVLICSTRAEAVSGIKKLMEDKVFGAAAAQIVIEEYLEGDELSLFAICDGENYVLLSSSQDHKKVLDGDKGKNTGGMGAYAPAPLATPDLIEKVRRIIIEPTLSAIAAEATPYKGVLYFGLMVDRDRINVLEYNCRFGDPETEVVLPLLKNDLVPILLASAEGNLSGVKVDVHKKWAIDVVLASGGYPDAYEKGKIIQGLDRVSDDIMVFHAGTQLKENKVVTSGGRVLNVVALGDDFNQVKDHLYKQIQKIYFDRIYYRKDIGYRAMKYFPADVK